MGGRGSGGARVGAGRTKLELQSFCEFCRGRMVSHRRNRRFCDTHRTRGRRRGDSRAAVLGVAIAMLRGFERQFGEPFADVGAVGAGARLALEQALSRVQTSALGGEGGDQVVGGIQ